MIVQYSFIEKHDYPGFKQEPIGIRSMSITFVGIIAMLVATAAYLSV